MSRHNADLIMCLNMPGMTAGQVCNKCDGKCPICDTFFNSATEVRLCDECAFTSHSKCVICGVPATLPAYYCRECTKLEKDRDGCPNILNSGSTKSSYHFLVTSQRNGGKQEL